MLAAGAVCLPNALGQTFDIKQPEVKKGLEIALDNTVQHAVRGDDIRGAFDQSLDYGVSEWWRLSGVLKLEDLADGDFRISRIAVENLFALGTIGGKSSPNLSYGWFTAIEASVHPDVTNSLIFGPIVRVNFDKLSFTANPFFEKTFGQNHTDGIAFNYGWQIKYEISPELGIGIEGFGLIENLGNAPAWENQEHRVGPVIYTEIALTKDLKITPDIGVLFGLTRATPDVAFKINVGIPLHQR